MNNKQKIEQLKQQRRGAIQGIIKSSKQGDNAAKQLQNKRRVEARVDEAFAKRRR